MRYLEDDSFTCLIDEADEAAFLEVCTSALAFVEALDSHAAEMDYLPKMAEVEGVINPIMEKVRAIIRE